MVPGIGAVPWSGGCCEGMVLSSQAEVRLTEGGVPDLTNSFLSRGAGSMKRGCPCRKVCGHHSSALGALPVAVVKLGVSHAAKSKPPGARSFSFDEAHVSRLVHDE